MLEKIKRLIAEGKNLNEPNEQGEFLLHKAIREKNLDAVSLLIQAGVNVNQLDDFENSPLMLASWENAQDIATLLLKNGAIIDAQNKGALTPFLVAVWQGNKEIADALYQAGADIQQANYEGETALLLAVKKDNLALVNKLLEMGVDIHHQNNEGMNALMLASFLGYSQMSKLLLNNGIDVNQISKDGNTALMFASSAGKLDIVKYLVESGADLSKKNKRELTAAEIAAEKSHKEVLNYFIDLLGENILSPKYKKLPKRFLSAVSKGKLDIVKQMMTGGIDINTTDENGTTPLMIASFEGHEPLVTYFIDMGADLMKKDYRGKIALDYAVQNEKYEIAGLLKEACENEKRNPRIFQIIQKGNVNHLKQLIEWGIYVNVENEAGETPLMGSVLKNDLEMMKLLLESGADPFLQNKKGEGVLDLIGKSDAIPFKMVQMVSLLKEFGVPINQKMKKNKQTIFDIILSRVKTPEEGKIIKKLLQSLGARSGRLANKNKDKLRD